MAPLVFNTSNYSLDNLNHIISIFQVHSENDLMRRQNAERLQLERDLVGSENQTFGEQAEEFDVKRRQIIENATKDLNTKLQGVYSYMSIYIYIYIHMCIHTHMYIEMCT